MPHKFESFAIIGRRWRNFSQIWFDFDQSAALFSFESTIEVRADQELPPLRALECIPLALHALERIPTA
jgi:hypothetical protein